MEITEKIAEKIINSKVLIEEALVPYKGVEISYIGYTNKDDEPFEWLDEDGDATGRYFALVSFKAMNPYQLAQAVEEFSNEEYDEACNHNLSLRMDVEKARELSAGMLGTLICHNVVVTNDDDEEVETLMAKSFAPIASVSAKQVSLKDQLKKHKKGNKEEEPKAKKDKKDKKGKKVVEETPEEPKSKKSKKGEKEPKIKI